MNWKELYALVNENIKNAVSGLYKPAGDVTFAELPELSQSVLGYTYTVTDAFTTDSRFTDYDTETQAGHSFPADTEVAVIVTGTTENPVYMFNVMGGIMDGYATKGDLDNYVEKEAGKSLSTNDYTDADKALVQDSPITVTATGTDLTLSTSSGRLNALTVYGKSEVVNGAIISAGEGWSVVRLADLTWTTTEHTSLFQTFIRDMYRITNVNERNKHFLCDYYSRSTSLGINTQMDNQSMLSEYRTVYVYDKAYTTISDFVNSLGDAILCYELDDPTQGNCIAIKTDDGGGIDGTMAVFETGTPLRGIPNTTVRDVMAWDGSTGTVTKNCGKVRLADLTWTIATNNRFIATPPNCYHVPTQSTLPPALMSTNKYAPKTPGGYNTVNYSFYISVDGTIGIKDIDYTTVSDFVTSLGDAELVYQLEIPTTEQLTSTENASIAGLRTYTPQTHAQNNAGAEMTASAYAGTANGKVVNELKQDVQSEISALKITQSATLTLTVADWSSNQQTVTYAHDTGKRNVIDVDPSNIEEWANCGILAMAETASGITFSCKAVPENALTFRVTSMGV